MRKTKIIATVGPKTRDASSVEKLIQAGANAIRINFSHDTKEIHGETAKTVQEVRKNMNIPIAIILDTKGPEIRTGVLKEDDIELKQGQKFILTTDEIEGDLQRVTVTYKDLPKDLAVGSKVLIDDGLIALQVVGLTDTDIECVVENGGVLGSRKGVNIPDVSINLPALTEKDIDDITYGVKIGFDYIAASFIRSAKDVLAIKEVLKKHGGEHIQIISKIENREGVDNIDEILEVTDAIMVARGDLGVEIPPEEVPTVQKMLIQKANKLGKPVVTATQMLESMIKNPRPTRAEASDVANAILDGTSAIMLSGETAKGDYPLEAVSMMDRIAREAEKTQSLYYITMKDLQAKRSMTNAVSYATSSAAEDLEANAIVTVTKTGYTAKSVSKFKPKCPIIACTTNEKALYQLNLVWGCIPQLISLPNDSTDTAFEVATERVREIGYANKGDVLVLTAGVPSSTESASNILKVQRV
jgi:pyruvate kinase